MMIIHFTEEQNEALEPELAQAFSSSERGKKGFVMLQVYDGGLIGIGRFVPYEPALEIQKILRKYKIR